jgi:phosphatidylglycerol lysyltransferase
VRASKSEASHRGAPTAPRSEIGEPPVRASPSAAEDRPLSPAAPSSAPGHDAPEPVLRARAIVLRHGWNATAYQIVNPGFSLWFAPERDAVVGYVRHAGVTVVAGAPVCPAARLPAVVRDFEAACAGTRLCYFGAGDRLESLLRREQPRALVLLGAQPVWRPADFGPRFQAHGSLRAQLNRARNKGVRVAEWPSAQAAQHPALLRCLEEWLAGRGLPPLRFLVEPHTLGRLWDRRVFVAERQGEPVGFLVASPVPARAGWLVEQLVRGRRAPNGTSELMVTTAMAMLAADGARWATLGLSPLSRRAGFADPPTPAWLRLTLGWVRAHTRRFYNFDGLDAFKAKLLPQWWEPIYAISDEPRLSPRTLYAIAAAFGGGSPLRLVGRALGRAVREEVRGLGRKA